MFLHLSLVSGFYYIYCYPCYCRSNVGSNEKRLKLRDVAEADTMSLARLIRVQIRVAAKTKPAVIFSKCSGAKLASSGALPRWQGLSMRDLAGLSTLHLLLHPAATPTGVSRTSFSSSASGL